MSEKAKPNLSPSAEKLQDVADKFKIDDVDKILLKLKLDYPSITLREMGAVVKMTHQAVSQRISKPSFQRAMTELLGTTDTFIQKAQREAARRLVSLINSTDDKVALEAIKLALTPLLSRHKLDVDLAHSIVFRTQIGSGGGLVRQMVTLDAEGQEISSKTGGEEKIEG